MFDSYVKQMFLGCESSCNRAFCKNVKDQSFLSKVAEKLSKHGDLFLCCNYSDLCNFTKNESRSFDSKRTCGDKTVKINFKDIQNQNHSLWLDFALDMFNLINHNQSVDFLDHRYCDTLKNKICDDELYILENIFKILLHNFNEKKGSDTGLIILRLFVSFDEFDFLTKNDLLVLCKVFVKVHHQSSHGLYESDNHYNFDKECLKTKIFSIKDYVHLVEVFTKLLENFSDPYIRTNNVFEELLNTYTILYLINEKLNVFPFKKFYLEQVCKKQNFKEEYRFFKAECKSLLQFNYILPLEVKAEVLKYENGDLMKSSLQDAFFKSLFEGATSPYLFITVGRNTIYKDTFTLLKSLKEEELKKQIKITFKNEEGVDSGGIRKEFFQLVSEEMQEDEELFVHKNNIIWIRNNETRLGDFEILGKLIGIALYNDVILNIPFPSMFFKKILDKEIDLGDLSEIEPEIYNTLCNIEKLSSSELNHAELTFRICYDGGVFDLMPEGDLINLTKQNVNSFIILYKDFVTSKFVFKPFEAIQKGFYSIIKKELVLYLQPKELEKIIVGTPCIDVQMLKKSSILNGYDLNDNYILQFWDVVESYCTEDKKKFLQFITGNDRIPIGGNENLKLVIMRNGCDTDRLPSSQTCFNTLLLPKYKNKEKMKEKMDKAIRMTKGFYLL
ncbi:hypothetical protein GVAV_001419 [Gurleya vavrai]